MHQNPRLEYVNLYFRISENTSWHNYLTFVLLVYVHFSKENLAWYFFEEKNKNTKTQLKSKVVRIKVEQSEVT